MGPGNDEDPSAKAKSLALLSSSVWSKLDLLCDEPARTSPIGPHIERLSMNSSVIDEKFRLRPSLSVRGIERAMDFSGGQTFGAGLKARERYEDS